MSRTKREESEAWREELDKVIRAVLKARKSGRSIPRVQDIVKVMLGMGYRRLEGEDLTRYDAANPAG